MHARHTPRATPTRLLRGLGVALFLVGAGCDSSSQGDGSAGTVGDATGPGTGEDSPGSATEGDGPTDTGGEPEPTPEVMCGDGVHTGPILIDPDSDSGVDPQTLDGIAILDGDLLIANTDYVNLDFLHCLKEVRGDIQIFNNAFLESISGTDGITRVGRLPAPNPTPSNPNFVDEGKGSITISSNPVLPDLDGFNGITQIGERDPDDSTNESSQSLVIRSNDGLTTITGFAGLQIIFESLVIQENPALKDIDGLRGLKVIDGFFSVTRNESLCSSSVIAVGEGLDFLGDEEHTTYTLNDDSC